MGESLITRGKLRGAITRVAAVFLAISLGMCLGLTILLMVIVLVWK